jgi:hypothetical protein
LRKAGRLSEENAGELPHARNTAVATRNRRAYEQLCRKILATFTDTTNPYWAQRMAIDCLLLPNPDVDLQLVDKLADIAVSRGSGEAGALPHFQVCKAMSSYRLVRYADALSWAEKALDSTLAHASAHACAVLSMANWQLGRQADARAMLIKGEALAPNIFQVRGTDKFGGSWVAWLNARIALDEAAAPVQSPQPENSANKP